MTSFERSLFRSFIHTRFYGYIAQSTVNWGYYIRRANISWLYKQGVSLEFSPNFARDLELTIGIACEPDIEAYNLQW